MTEPQHDAKDSQETPAVRPNTTDHPEVSVDSLRSGLQLLNELKVSADKIQEARLFLAQEALRQIHDFAQSGEAKVLKEVFKSPAVDLDDATLISSWVSRDELALWKVELDPDSTVEGAFPEALPGQIDVGESIEVRIALTSMGIELQGREERIGFVGDSVPFGQLLSKEAEKTSYPHEVYRQIHLEFLQSLANQGIDLIESLKNGYQAAVSETTKALQRAIGQERTFVSENQCSYPSEGTLPDFYRAPEA